MQVSYEIIVSGGEVNRLSDGRCGERLPAVNLSHVDLSRSEQRPEQHGGGFGGGQHGLRRLNSSCSRSIGIRSSGRSNTDLLRESLVYRHSRLPIPHRHA